MYQDPPLIPSGESFIKLREAIERSDVTKVKNLIRARIEIDSPSWKYFRRQEYDPFENRYTQTEYMYSSPLIYAFKEYGISGLRNHTITDDELERRIQIMTLLLKAGANPNVFYKIDVSIFQDDEIDNRVLDEMEIRALELNRAVFATMAEKSLLELVTTSKKECSLRVARLLLENGADVNTRTGIDHSEPLINLLIVQRRIDMIKLLIEKGADLNIKYRGCGGSLGVLFLMYHMYAAYVQEPFVNFVNLLLDNGADINSSTVLRSFNKDDNMPRHIFTPLMQVVKFSKPEIILIQLLIDRGADVNLKTNTTALHVAAFSNNIEIINLLLKYGANPNITDDEGKYPCDLATDERVKALLSPTKSVTEMKTDENVEINL